MSDERRFVRRVLIVLALTSLFFIAWQLRTLILMLDGMEGVERASARDPEADRIGGRSADYHRRVDTAFRTIAATEPDRVRLINASGSPENVTAKLVEAIADLLP